MDVSFFFALIGTLITVATTVATIVVFLLKKPPLKPLIITSSVVLLVLLIGAEITLHIAYPEGFGPGLPAQPSGSDLLGDPTARSLWQRTPSCVFKPNGYHLLASQGSQGLTVCKRAASSLYHNGIITLNMCILSGGSGGIGFRFPFQSPGFFFEMDANRRYKLSYSGQTLINWTTLSILNQSSTVPCYDLAVVMENPSLSLYINQAFITTCLDPYTSQDTSAGQLALFASPGAATTDTDILFTNFHVTPLSYVPARPFSWVYFPPYTPSSCKR